MSNLCIYLSRKVVCGFRKIWNKGTEKLPNISLSLGVVNKPPSLISPLSIKTPSGKSAIKEAPRGLNRAFTVFAAFQESPFLFVFLCFQLRTFLNISILKT